MKHEPAEAHAWSQLELSRQTTTAALNATLPKRPRNLTTVWGRADPLVSFLVVPTLSPAPALFFTSQPSSPLPVAHRPSNGACAMAMLCRQPVPCGVVVLRTNPLCRSAGLKRLDQFEEEADANYFKKLGENN